MFRSIRWRLSLPFSILISLVVLSLGGFLVTSARAYLIDNLTQNLFSQNQLLIGILAQEDFDASNADELNALAVSWSNEIDARITLVDAAGVVLGESHQAPALMGNHKNRPEILQALTDGRGTSIRYSDTLKMDTLYVGLPVHQNGLVVGVARLALPLDKVNADINQLQRLIIIATVIAAFLAVLMADQIARITVRPLRQLTLNSKKIAQGKKVFNTVTYSKDEIGELALAMNQMSDRLQGQIEALNAEREKLSAILQQMDSGVLIVDPNGKLGLVNKAAEQIFGIDADQVMGKSLVEILRYYQIVEVWEQSKAENLTKALELELVRKRQSLQVIATPLGGVMKGNVVLIFQDLTQMRRLETIRRDFVSNISHELRTPLASLKSLAETLLDGALDDPPASRRFLKRIETEVDSLSLLVQELLELARIESGRVPLKFEYIQASLLIQSAVERLYLQAERAGLEIKIEVPQHLPLVRADPPRMQQVIMNLLHNAIKFTHTGGQIHLGARLEENESVSSKVIFHVRDTGVGIPSDDLSRIFERFYKADRARSGGGTGLGLAIAKHLVESHGGQIWATSSPDEGSSFFFALPTQ